MIEAEKQIAAKAALQYIKSNMVVGLGTGSTANYFIRYLGEAVKNEALHTVKCVASSNASNALAREVGLDVIPLNSISKIDVTVDGADEFDSDLNLIKGGGGALVQEKIIASLSSQFIVITDAKKKVPTLGAFKLPVEVFEFASMPILNKLAALGLHPTLRKDALGTVFISDNGNTIIDLDLQKIEQPQRLQELLQSIPGILDHGLFLGFASVVLMGVQGKVIEFTT